jgi:hypothetical protein
MPKTSRPYVLALRGGAGAGRDYAVTEKNLRELAAGCDGWLDEGRSAKQRNPTS